MSRHLTGLQAKSGNSDGGRAGVGPGDAAARADKTAPGELRAADPDLLAGRNDHLFVVVESLVAWPDTVDGNSDPIRAAVAYHDEHIVAGHRSRVACWISWDELGLEPRERHSLQHKLGHNTTPRGPSGQ